ncbi:hypothetical protein [Chryseobacterium oryctis]|uniref:Uncharacterized protein n=1 Tax=Chryseobacterium oryctis TaxID=2952618 RepID=A0ABT3HL25_9FLAO|nr:hypothetical protein [Chryseobacterium oryctis]MCW3160375.1 hypothetical protein [Chryseobacterium oryctis]
MKKGILNIFLTLSSIYLSAQAPISINDIKSEVAVFNNIKGDNYGKSLTYDQITGTPYLDKNFNKAKVSQKYEEVPIRYNSYKDEIEFKKNETILVLPKDSEFSKIQFTNSKQIIALIETSDDLSGYFFKLVDGKNSLYKKDKIIFIDIVPAANSYAADKPAAFKKLPSIYYIQTEKGEYIKRPKNPKDIIAQFPDKKESLNIFFKSNKIKFDKEEDLVKLINFLNQD